MTRSAERHVLQFCHGYDGPFLDCTRQYARLFADTGYRVTTVFLTGVADPEVAAACASDEVLFMEYSSKAIRGLKLGAMRDLRKIVASRDFTFCIAHRFKPIFITLWGTHLPVIGVHHAFGDYERRTRKLFAFFFRKRLSLLGVSDAVRDDIRRCLPRWPTGRIRTLHNRVDVAELRAHQLSPVQARQALGLRQDAWVVGNVGRLHPDKDQATLLRAFARARPLLPADSQLAIMGSGRLEQDLKELARELGIAEHVLFLGEIRDGRRFFQAFDVFALTSDNEPFGMVLLEAMAAGLPVVSTSCGGAKEVVEGVGILAPLGDDEQFAAALVHLSRLDDEQRHDCAERMLERLNERFSDRAASETFWRLPQVTDLTAEG
ncbi:group 1 glycosyl transferase [Pseudomonas sp. M47T1]|uniref:glycosyltransferase n=1 Tax=Pseudomonas sp. M47T1 TaxID=1179778 RepID=UPI0002606B66|nr:glycosyltransferase [Pseudomonas sp. M47T1]EIK96948.1 group 1 glycosyl transferase [Pseudomonas sp. M47T1]